MPSLLFHNHHQPATPSRGYHACLLLIFAYGAELPNNFSVEDRYRHTMVNEHFQPVATYPISMHSRRIFSKINPDF